MPGKTFVSIKQKGYLWHNKKDVYKKYMSRISGTELEELPWYKVRSGEIGAGRYTKQMRKAFVGIRGLYKAGKISARKYTSAVQTIKTRARSLARGEKVGKLQIDLVSRPGRPKKKR